ncbi:hypothetical protein [Lysinibacillus sp. 54212]|uniref:hypothetical protein n=1 Tax=Lysinibacillus sp. 54212 TaxID=3119829 RepID=UPI002FC75679
MKKWLILVILLCAGCSSSDYSLSGSFEQISQKEYKSMIKKYELNNIERKDFYEVSIVFEWKSNKKIKHFNVYLIDNLEEIINEYDGASGYFSKSTISNIDYEEFTVAYETQFLFYAKNSNGAKIKELFRGEKFIVSRVEDGKEVQDIIGIDSLINVSK